MRADTNNIDKGLLREVMGHDPTGVAVITGRCSRR